MNEDERVMRESLVDEVARKLFAEEWSDWKWDDDEYVVSRARAIVYARYLLGLDA